MSSLHAGPYHLTVRLVTEQERHLIIELQEKVYASLAEPEQLQRLTEEEMTVIIQQQLFAGAFLETGELIAVRAFLRPGHDSEHLAQDVGIPKEQWDDVIYSEVTLVDPDFQGHDLQKKLGDWWLKQLEGSDTRYICATVAPFNIASIKDKFQLGMEIAALKYKYQGKLRYVFVKNLQEERNHAHPTYKVQMKDVDKQQQLLSEQYRGIALSKEKEEWWVSFTKEEQ